MEEIWREIAFDCVVKIQFRLYTAYHQFKLINQYQVQIINQQVTCAIVVNQWQYEQSHTSDKELFTKWKLHKEKYLKGLAQVIKSTIRKLRYCTFTYKLQDLQYK